MLRIRVLSAVMLMSYAVLGQNLQGDLRKVNSFFNNQTVKAFEVEYASYTDGEVQIPEDQVDGFYVIDDLGNYYTDDDLSTRLKSGDDLMVIDKEAMEIVLITDTIGTNLLSFDNIDSLLRECDSIRLLIDNERLRRYQLYLPVGLSIYNKISLEINIQEWYVSEMNLFYTTNWSSTTDGPRLQIKMKEAPVTSDIKKLLSLSSYLHKENGKTIPHQKYRNYEMVNLSSR